MGTPVAPGSYAVVAPGLCGDGILVTLAGCPRAIFEASTLRGSRVPSHPSGGLLFHRDGFAFHRVHQGLAYDIGSVVYSIHSSGSSQS